MPVNVSGQIDRRVTKPFLHDLHRQSEAAVLLAIDAPARVVMSECVQSIFWFAVLIYNTGRDLRRFEAPMQDVGVMLDLAGARWKHEIKLTLRALKLPLAEHVHDRGGEGYRALPGLRLRLANLLVPIGALPDVQFALF